MAQGQRRFTIGLGLATDRHGIGRTRTDLRLVTHGQTIGGAIIHNRIHAEGRRVFAPRTGRIVTWINQTWLFTLIRCIGVRVFCTILI